MRIPLSLQVETLVRIKAVVGVLHYSGNFCIKKYLNILTAINELNALTYKRLL